MAFSPRPAYTWKLRSRALTLGRRTLLMAIVNLTPDSFSGDGLAGRGLDAAVAAGLAAIDGGADILDLGAESTRPGAAAVSPGEEQARLLPALEAILRERPDAVISVDSYQAATARAAARAGAEIVNDVSGLTWDDAMAGVVASTGCGLILMHTRGRPQEWSTQAPLAEDDVLPAVFAGLCEQLTLAEAAGIPDEAIVIDPGFGFGKRGTENFSLLAGLGRLHELGRPMLIGLSRKGFLGDAVRPVQKADPRPGSPARLRSNATLAGNVASALAGAHILRVHDLQPAREIAAVADAVLFAAGGWGALPECLPSARFSPEA